MAVLGRVRSHEGSFPKRELAYVESNKSRWFELQLGCLVSRSEAFVGLSSDFRYRLPEGQNYLKVGRLGAWDVRPI